MMARNSTGTIGTGGIFALAQLLELECITPPNYVSDEGPKHRLGGGHPVRPYAEGNWLPDPTMS